MVWDDFLCSAAIGMAMYIHKLQRRRCLENEDGGSDRLPFGYKRSEVIGGLINGVALVSLSCYVSHYVFSAQALYHSDMRTLMSFWSSVSTIRVLTFLRTELSSAEYFFRVFGTL